MWVPVDIFNCGEGVRRRWKSYGMGSFFFKLYFCPYLVPTFRARYPAIISKKAMFVTVISNQQLLLDGQIFQRPECWVESLKSSHFFWNRNGRWSLKIWALHWETHNSNITSDNNPTLCPSQMAAVGMTALSKQHFFLICKIGSVVVLFSQSVWFGQLHIDSIVLGLWPQWFSKMLVRYFSSSENHSLSDGYNFYLDSSFICTNNNLILIFHLFCKNINVVRCKLSFVKDIIYAWCYPHQWCSLLIFTCLAESYRTTSSPSYQCSFPYEGIVLNVIFYPPTKWKLVMEILLC